MVEAARYLVQRDPANLNIDVGRPAQLVDSAAQAAGEFWLFSPRNEDPVKLAADGQRRRVSVHSAATPGLTR